MTSKTLPNLAGVIKTTDIYKKMKFDYVAWAKTAQILREHAPGWQFCLDKSTSEEGVSSYIFKAPDGTGFLMGYFEHIDTGVKTTLFPFAITDNANRPLQKITSVNFQNSHRRCLCACACFTFGLAYELWAQIEIEDAKKEEVNKREGKIARTPTKPKQPLESVDSIEDKNYGKPIAKSALDAVVTKMTNLSQKYPDKKDLVIDKYKKQFGITSEKIGPADIRTAEQGQFLTIAINEIDSNL